MEGRRLTRGRPRIDDIKETLRKRTSPGRTTNVSPSTKRGSPRRPSPGRNKISPARAKLSPTRRSSRPRSAALGKTTNATVVSLPSPIKEMKEKKTSKSSPNTRSNLPSTLTTNTSSRAPFKSATSTSSVHSSYSSTTQKTVEIRSSAAPDEKIVSKIKDYMRRSMSKGAGDSEIRHRHGSHTPTTNTEGDSRYSRSVSRSMYDDDKSSKAEFSDNDEKKSTIAGDVVDEEDEHFKSFSTTQHDGVVSSPPRNWRKLETPREFGGMWGISILLLVIPTLVYYLQWSCGKSSCDFKSLKLDAIVNVKYLTERVFPVDAVGAYLMYILSLFLFSGIMYGRHVNVLAELSRQVYNFNALPLAILVTIAGGVAEYLKYPVADFVLRNYLRFCIYGLLNAFIVAFWCYIRARIQTKDTFYQINPYAKTGNFIIDFALGRQLNPKWLGFIDYKQAFYRISLISTLIFAECFLYKKIQLPTGLPEAENAFEMAKHYARNLHYDAGTIFAASLLLVYIVDAIVFEHHLASSFELQGEGFGCLLLLRYAATPYLLSSVAKYFYDRRMPTIACKYGMYIAWAVLVFGLILKRFSSAIKYKYRTNPGSLYFRGVESIHTFQGKRLLLGGIWGRLRQPNYTGDIIALWALITPIFLRFSWPPLISIGLIILLLLHRPLRVNARNISRYHSAWVRYCTKVPNYIAPKIY